MNPDRWKMPPIAKVYEALGAIADERVKIQNPSHATVVSSDGSRVYEVETSADGRTISSNDNASYWQGYLGYPGIAVMIAQGLRRPRDDVLKALKGVPWREFNRRFHNDYERTIEEVMRRAKENGFDPPEITAEAEATLAAVRDFGPLRGPRRRPPAPSRESPRPSGVRKPSAR